MGNKWGSREGSPESKGEIVELLTAFWLRLDSVLNCITSWQEWCWVGVQTVSTVLYLVLYMYLYVLYPHPPIDITVCNSYLEVCLQAPYRNTISLHYINITRSDQPIRSSSLININAKWLWLFTYMTIGLQHHLFLQISSDVSHAREKKKSLMLFTMLPARLLRELSHHNHCSWCLLGETILPATQLASKVATTAWPLLCRPHQMLQPSSGPEVEMFLFPY